MSLHHPTIVDLARELGLSKTTVSDALSGRGRVAEETRTRILDAARRAGYAGNRAARSLRSSKTGAMGLYIPPTVRSFGFYMDFAFGTAHEAASLDVDLLLIARDYELTTRRLPPVDGLVVVDPVDNDGVITAFLDSGVPVVTAGRLPGGQASRVRGVVEATHRRTSRELAERLAAAASGEVAYLGADPGFAASSMVDMLEGYRDYCRQSGQQPREALVSLRADDATLLGAVAPLVADPAVGALVGGPQGFAARALPAVRAAGRTAGDGGLLVATLVSDPAGDAWNAAVNAVDLMPFDFGRECVDLLGEIVRGEHDEASDTVTRVHATRLRLAPSLGG